MCVCYLAQLSVTDCCSINVSSDIVGLNFLYFLALTISAETDKCRPFKRKTAALKKIFPLLVDG